jgi:hypothetical protein
MLFILACSSMIVDHLGLLFFPDIIWFRFVGRIAFPLFAVGVGLGSVKTRDIDKYIFRLFLCACLSQFPYYLATGLHSLNVLFTLSAGILIYRIFLQPGDGLRWSFALVVPLILFFPVSYGLPGVVFVTSCCLSYRFNVPFHFIVGIVFCFTFKDMSFFFGIPFITALVFSWFLSFPLIRLPRWFKYSFYPLQWLAFSIFLSFGHFFS